MIHRLLLMILSITCLFHLRAQAQAQGQISLPIISDPSFRLLDGEIIVSHQLNSWGIKIGPIKLDLGIDLSSLGLNLSDLGLGLKKRKEGDGRRSRSSIQMLSDHLEYPTTSILSNSLAANQLSDESGLGIIKRLLGLDLGLLNLGLNLGFGTKSPQSQSQTSNSKPKSKALINLNLDTDLSSLFSWGGADNVARGERGDTEWFTYISVGTPPQSIPVLPDTGSSDLFVFGSECQSCNLANHTYFDSSLSTTYKDISGDWVYYYADGSGALGYTSRDTISFGSADRIVSEEMEFAIATDIGGDDFNPSQRSGVLGLGLDSMSTFQSQSQSEGSTLFSKLVKSGSLSENVLSIRLEKGQQSQGVIYEEGKGQYTLGGIEEDYIVGGRNGMIWNDVMSQNYWGITMEDISVGSESILSQDNTTPRRAIIDTGTTLIITSDAASSMIHAHIQKSWQDPKSSIWYIPCDTSYPSTGNVFFTISGRRFGVPISDLAWKRSGSFEGMCISGIQGGMEGFTVLGDMFIKNHYVVLSYDDGGETGKIQVGLGDRTDILPIL